MRFRSGKDRQTGYLRKKRGVCNLCPTNALGIRGWLYKFGTDITVVNLDDTSTSAVIRDLEQFLVV
jgi:hypothetical protein